jgi:hypothetical protein
MCAPCSSTGDTQPYTTSSIVEGSIPYPLLESVQGSGCEVLKGRILKFTAMLAVGVLTASTMTGCIVDLYYDGSE